MVRTMDCCKCVKSDKCGSVPAWCVAVQASRRREFPGGEFGLPCVLVIKRLPPGQRHDKAQLNDVLRQHGVTG